MAPWLPESSGLGNAAGRHVVVTCPHPGRLKKRHSSVTVCTWRQRAAGRTPSLSPGYGGRKERDGGGRRGGWFEVAGPGSARRFVSLFTTGLSALLRLDRSSCFWGGRLVFRPQCRPEEAASWSSHAGVCPLLFCLLLLSPVLAGDLPLGGTVSSLLWHPGLHGLQPLSLSLLLSHFPGHLRSLELGAVGIAFPLLGAGFWGEVARGRPSYACAAPSAASSLGAGPGSSPDDHSPALQRFVSAVHPGIDQVHSGCSLKSPGHLPGLGVGSA